MAAAEKVHKAGIKRDNDMMYYVKNGDVWQVPRKKPGQPKGKAEIMKNRDEMLCRFQSTDILDRPAVKALRMVGFQRDPP